MNEEEAKAALEKDKEAGNLIPACRFLELRLPQIEREAVTPYLTGEKVGEDNQRAFWDFVNNFGHPRDKKYMPYCSKTGRLCVVMESPVISMQMYGDMYQPLGLTLMKANRI